MRNLQNEKMRCFRIRAKGYQACAARMRQLKENGSGVGENGPEYLPAAEEYRMLEEHNAFVERVIRRAGKKYGAEAEGVLWKCYTEGYTQLEVSRMYHVGLRTLQRWLCIWLKEGLAGEGE